MNRHYMLLVVGVLLISNLLANGQTPEPAVGWGNGSYVNVPSGVQFKQIAASGDAATGITSNGTLVAWGYDGWGEVSQVPTGTFKAVSGGGQFLVGIRTDGSLVVWGNNYGGIENVPTGSFTEVAAAGSGGYDAIGILADGTLTGWGPNYNPANTPAGDFKDIAIGGYTAYAITDNGTLDQFPASFGVQGDAGTPPDGIFTAVSAGGVNGADFAVAIRADGTLAGWGEDDFGQTNVPSGTFSEIACGFDFAVGLRTDGTLVEWGDPTQGLSSVPDGQFQSISASNGGAAAFAIAAANGVPLPRAAWMGISLLGGYWAAAGLIRRQRKQLV